MDRRLDWIVSRGGFAAALYFAFVEQVEWVQYALTAFILWMFASSLYAVMDARASRRFAPSAVSPTCGMTFDLAVLASLFLAHQYWTAFTYAAACGCLALAQARTTSKS
jgi:hypothetical protein